MDTRLRQAHDSGPDCEVSKQQASRFICLLKTVDKKIAHYETFLAALFGLTIVLLLLLNVLTRTFGTPLFWVDELAIYAMVWMGFLGTSLAIHYRQHIAVTVCIDLLPTRLHQFMLVMVDAMMLALLLVLAMLIWNWFDPVNLLKANSLSEFSAQRFNFIYEEPTTTLDMRKFWFWLILPIFCVLAIVHCVHNLVGTIKQLCSNKPSEALT